MLLAQFLSLLMPFVHAFGSDPNPPQPQPSKGWVPNEPPIPGVMPSTIPGRPKLLVAMDITYPPYAYIETPPAHAEPTRDEEVRGVGADMIKAMAKFGEAHNVDACKFDVDIIQADWSQCWGDNYIGEGLSLGAFHACMTYTHPYGVRNRFLEFSNSWATKNKPSGLITRLVDGKPFIDGWSDLAGKIIVDVTGWAPTADTLYWSKNQCSGNAFAGNFTIIGSADIEVEGEYAGANDKALMALLQRKADAAWIYADQADNYNCYKSDPHDALERVRYEDLSDEARQEGEEGKAGVTGVDTSETTMYEEKWDVIAHGTTSKKKVQEGWSCELWSKFGEKFAYIQTGVYEWLQNGTTVAFAKKGSGVTKILDACLTEFMESEEFYDVCATDHMGHSQLKTCVPNKFFPPKEELQFQAKQEPWMLKTDGLTDEFTKMGITDGCQHGYCTCMDRAGRRS